ncbi:MFS transporter, partial [Klebsiella pneumoniae]|uniref:MFS transporter n=1 Tax=Klebsiella pneumoniae TaxID=573 RepID=UPI001F07F9BF
VCAAAAIWQALVVDRYREGQANRVFATIMPLVALSPALAPLLGGLLAEAFGWRAPFWFLVGYALLVLVLIALRLPETRPADTVPVKGLPVRQYARILSDRRFLSFAVVNSGAMGMALTYVSLAPNVLMGTAGLTPLQFSLVFGANGFWIMLVSFFANRIIHKVGRPVCLATGGMLMG